jgi:putative phosphoribosyl transferase
LALQRGNPPSVSLIGDIDDGLATGSTMKAAVEAVRQHQPVRVVVAAPVGGPSTCRELAALADEVVCAMAPNHFAAVGEWYADFSQTEDDCVLGERHATSRSR